MTSGASRGPGVARRTVVGACVGSLVALAAGCRVRLEDDAPRIPLVPTREPVPDEALLVGLVAQLRELARDARALGGSAAALAAQHERQADVVTQVLRGQRVPESTISPTPTTAGAATGTPAGAPGATGSPAPSGAPTLVTRPLLAAAEARAVAPERLRSLAGLTTPLAAQVRSIAVHRAVAAHQLGARLVWPSTQAAAAQPSPSAGDATGPGASSPTTATTDAPRPTTSATGTAAGASPGDGSTRRADAMQAAMLAAFREAAYRFEVAAARSGTAERSEDGTESGPPAGTHGATAETSPSQRALLLADARWAHGRAREIVSSVDSAPAPPVGYPLPSPPATPEQARALALAAYRRLELAVGDRLPDGGEHSAAVVEALADVVVRGRRWGLPLRPFPGLADPPPTPSTAPSPATTSPRPSTTGAS